MNAERLVRSRKAGAPGPGDMERRFFLKKILSAVGTKS